MLREIVLNDYGRVFNFLVNRTADYLISSKVESVVLGISGGIDSTIVAAIGQQAADKAGIRFIGRSLTIKNTEKEQTVASKVGKAFCSDFKEVNISDFYRDYLLNMFVSEYSENRDYMFSEFSIEELEKLDCFSNKISNGNIMARIRMSYLYDLAGRNKGLVLDTDNLTEHYLGFWTIHGDEGDFNPIGGLWKTEVFKLSEWYYLNHMSSRIYPDDLETTIRVSNLISAIKESLCLIPTDGNGISSSDLEQIGGKDYYEVDKILRPIVVSGEKAVQELIKTEDKEFIETVYKIYNRFLASQFKRRTDRVIRITREDIFNHLITKKY